MVLPALPKLIKKEQVRFPIVLRVGIRDKTGSYAGRVEKNAVWVLKGLKFPITERITDMFRETGSHKQDLVPIADRLRKGRDGYG